ncbi:MAG: hypothetical protein EBE86_005005 [Hormoscilla sp. GUM202]|nr:hypothetical protein [Hormoscilla sp. GUM202]
MEPGKKRRVWAMTPAAWIGLTVLFFLLTCGGIWSWWTFAHPESPEQAADRANMLQAIYEHGNYIEAAIWSIFAAVFAVTAVKQSGIDRTWSIVAALTFFFFGLSDIVEVFTGGWWPPWWLFLWNAACVASMVGLLVTYLRYLR